MRASAGVCVLLIALFGAACSPAPATQVVASLATPEVTTEPSATPTEVVPTPTPLRRATLPATWTPTPEPTAAPTEPATSTPLAVVNATTGADLRIGNCLQFGPDLARNPTSVVVGRPATVYWTPSGGGVFYYEVVLRDANGVEIDSSRRMPSSRQYTFSADLFDFNSVYTWTVTPYNSSAEPICDSRTSEIRATLR